MTRRAPTIALTLFTLLSVVANADGISIGIGEPAPPPSIPAAIDAAWGNSGYVTFTDQSITAKAVDGQGRLLVAGQTTTGAKVRRLLANGQPDISFGSNGAIEVSVGGSGFSDRPTTVIPLAEGGFLFLAQQDASGLNTFSPKSSLIRFNSSGSLDVSFGDEGEASFLGMPVDMVRDRHGRLYLLTSHIQYMGNVDGFGWRLLRLLPNGGLDVDFGTEGEIALPSSTSMVMTLRAGDWLHFQYFDRDDGCDVRNLGVSEFGDTFEACDIGSGRTIKLISIPAFGTPDAVDGAASFTLETPEGYLGGIYSTDETLDAQPYPLGFIQTLGPDRIDVQVLAPSSDQFYWSFNSPEHLDRISSFINTKVRVDAEAGLLISFNSPICEGLIFPVCPPATIFRSAPLPLDLTPSALPAIPVVTHNGLYYTSTAITVSGLGEYVNVPVRVTGGQISLDGEVWLNGWAWAHNGRQIWVRYTDNATLTIGGVISPNNPSLAIGSVQTLTFAGASVTVSTPAPATPSSSLAAENDDSGGSGGGSTDWTFFSLLGLALAGRHGRLRKRLS